MITINKLEILNNGSTLAIDVETTPGYTITSLLFWSMDDFKDYNMAVDLTGKLEKINNREVLLVNVLDLEVGKIEDMCFIEVESNAPANEDDDCDCNDCSKPVLGIAYDFSKYYKCLMHYLLDGQASDCTTCESINNSDLKMAVAVNLLIDTATKGIEAGFYQQVVDMVNDLKSLCKHKECINCEKIVCKSCNKFKQQ